MVEFDGRCVVTLVSECDLRLGCSRGAVAGEPGEVRSFDAVGSVLEEAVDGVELLLESPVLTAVLEASDVVCAPVDVEDRDGELVDAAVGEFGESPVLTAVLGAFDVVCAPVDVEDRDGELVDAAVGELVEVLDE